MQKIKPNISLFHIFSLGYVVENNHKDCLCEPVIKVIPLEYINNEDISNMLFKLRQTVNAGTDESKISNLVINERIKIKIKSILEDNKSSWKKIEDTLDIIRQRWIYSTWLSFNNPNDFNPPCLVKGDIVILYKYGNMNTYFWESIFKRTPDENKTAEGNIKRYISSNIKEKKVEKEVTVSACSSDISYKIHNINYTTGIYNYLDMSNGELQYLDQLGNIFSINQNGDINFKATNNLISYAVNNMYLSCGKIMDIAPSNLLAITTKDIVMLGKNGVSITGGSSVVIKGGAITLQGNVVVNGNLAIAGTVVPGKCPCCCKCKDGGGGGGKISTPTPDIGYIEANQKVDTLYSNKDNERKSFIEKIVNFSKSVVKAITDKIGIGS